MLFQFLCQKVKFHSHQSTHYIYHCLHSLQLLGYFHCFEVLQLRNAGYLIRVYLMFSFYMESELCNMLLHSFPVIHCNNLVALRLFI